MKGSLYKRCKCRGVDGRELGSRCPDLRRADGSYNPKHGTWYARLEADPDPDTGRRRMPRRGGFRTKDDAASWLDDIKDKMARGVDVTRRVTVADYLPGWLSGKADIAPSTRKDYSQHVRALWVPQLGRLEMSAVRRSHVEDALATLSVSDATRQRYRATLRAAFADAMRDGLVTVNVAALARLAAGKRPKARVWTDARMVAWEVEYELRRASARAGGGRVNEFQLWHDMSARPSPVMVWTPQQVGRFLDHAVDHPLYALYHLIAFRGLRRGEACGARREHLDLDAGVLTVAWQITTVGGQVIEGKPKTDASDADVVLDSGTVTVLREHLVGQCERRREWGSAWVESGYVFTREDGSRLDPGKVTEDFERIAFSAGLPPIRLHDLRHSAASIMHKAGADMKVIQATLRHSNQAITADTYTSVFEDVDRAAAEAAALVVPRGTPKGSHGTGGLPSGSHATPDTTSARAA